MQAFTIHGKEADARQGAAGRAPFATWKLPGKSAGHPIGPSAGTLTIRVEGVLPYD